MTVQLSPPRRASLRCYLGVKQGCLLSYLGVKQGCPLSSDLFGIFTDELEKVMNALPNSGVLVLPQKLVREGITYFRKLCLLLYADDLVLLSISRGLAKPAECTALLLL